MHVFLVYTANCFNLFNTHLSIPFSLDQCYMGSKQYLHIHRKTSHALVTLHDCRSCQIAHSTSCPVNGNIEVMVCTWRDWSETESGITRAFTRMTPQQQVSLISKLPFWLLLLFLDPSHPPYIFCSHWLLHGSSTCPQQGQTFTMPYICWAPVRNKQIITLNSEHIAIKCQFASANLTLICLFSGDYSQRT